MWLPQKKQRLVLSCHYDEILYGGAAGGGKSSTLLMDGMNHIIKADLERKRSNGVLFRKTYKELDEIIKQSHECFEGLGWQFSKDNYRWATPEGSQLTFSYLSNYQDALSHRGFEYDWMGWDELTLWSTNEEYDYLKTRLRHTVRNKSMTPIVPRVIGTTNPGGPGHDWVMKYWGIDQNPNGMKPIRDVIILEDGREVTKTRIFIPAKLRDNYYLYSTGHYEAQLRDKPENVRKMLLDGRWDVVEGAFFTEWEPAIHTMRPFSPPADWTRVMGADWGTRSPYCFLWGAYNPNGELFIYRELYGHGDHEPAAEVADKIRRIEEMAGEDIRERYLDSSCFDRTGGEETTADVFSRKGVFFQPSAKKNKKFSIDRLRDYLKITNGQTSLHIMGSCPNLIRTLPTLQVDRSNPDQFDTNGEDHACISGNTTVITNVGPLRAKDLVGKRFGVITPGGIVMDCLCDKTGEKMVYEVLLSNGERIECTDDHRLLTAGGGFVQLKHLLTCDILAYGGQDGCAGLITNGAKIQRGELLSVREILSAQWQEAPSCGLEVPQWPSASEASHPSFGWGPGEQPITESEIDVWARSLVIAYDRGTQGVEPEEHQEGTGCCSSLAQVTRGACLAYGTRKDVGGQDQTEMVPCPENYENLLHVHGDIREQGGFVLLQSSLSNPGSQPWHYGVRIESIRAKGIETVYDIGVPFAHCYTLGSGVVAHNCDALLYMIRRGQRSSDENARIERAKMLNKARLANIGKYGAH